MKNINLSIVIAIALILVAVFVMTMAPTSRVVVYNCSIAEISPDIPLRVKEECRKLNAEAYRK